MPASSLSESSVWGRCRSCPLTRLRSAQFSRPGRAPPPHKAPLRSWLRQVVEVTRQPLRTLILLIGSTLRSIKPEELEPRTPPSPPRPLTGKMCVKCVFFLCFCQYAKKKTKQFFKKNTPILELSPDCFPLLVLSHPSLFTAWYKHADSAEF